MIDILELVLQRLDLILKLLDQWLVLDFDLLSVDKSLCLLYLFLLILFHRLLFNGFIHGMHQFLLVDDRCPFNRLLDVLVQVNLASENMDLLQLLYFLLETTLLLLFLWELLLLLPQLLIHNLLIFCRFNRHHWDLSSILLRYHYSQFLYLLCVFFQQRIFWILINDRLVLDEFGSGGVSQSA